jgi:hypothetical protein
MKSRIAVALGVLASVVALVAKTAAQGPGGPTCEAVTKDPAKYAGKQVSFFGTASNNFSFQAHEGKSRALAEVNCKTQDGEQIDGKFAYAISDEHTGKGDLSKIVSRYTGMVKGTVTMGPFRGGSKSEVVPFLENVKIELPGNVK